MEEEANEEAQKKKEEDEVKIQVDGEMLHVALLRDWSAPFLSSFLLNTSVK